MSAPFDFDSHGDYDDRTPDDVGWEGARPPDDWSDPQDEQADAGMYDPEWVRGDLIRAQTLVTDLTFLGLCALFIVAIGFLQAAFG